MNEIKKMYKTIFGEFAPNCSLCVKLVDCKIFNNTHNCNKFECDYKRLFTAEKQLNLTKLIGLIYGLKFIRNEGMDYMLSTDLYNNDEFDEQGYGYGYDEAIANLINNLWQDLTEEEQQQIKEILE